MIEVWRDRQHDKVTKDIIMHTSNRERVASEQ
jgi:hypothetical protein